MYPVCIEEIKKMFTFGEMIYVCGVATVCFLSCVFKTAFHWKGGYEGVVAQYILVTFALYTCAFLMFFFLRYKCREYENKRKREVFLAAKKLKNISEMMFVTVLLFFIFCLYDIFNPRMLVVIASDITALFKSYSFYEVLLGLSTLVFGFWVIWSFYETNKLFSIMEFHNLKKEPNSVYNVIKQYPTFEEYERGITTGNTAPPPAKVRRSASAEQERFLRENEVPIEDIESRLTGLDNRQLRNGRPVYRSTFDYGSTPPGDNSLTACPFCGSLNKEGSEECSFCGAHIK